MSKYVVKCNMINTIVGSVDVVITLSKDVDISEARTKAYNMLKLLRDHSDNHTKEIFFKYSQIEKLEDEGGK